MRTLKFHPFVPAINHVVEELFNRNIGQVLGHDAAQSQVAVNIQELEDSFLIAVAAPGFQKENFHINVEKNQLSIKGEKTSAKASENVEAPEAAPKPRFTRREFHYGNFSRHFTLTESVDADSISATYEQGILSVTLPKKAVVVPPVKNITIQ